MPLFLLNLLFSKWFWIALSFTVIFSYAGYERWQHHRWEEKYETYRIEVIALGKEAERKATETKARQYKVTKEVKANAEKDRNRIVAYYERRLLDNASSGLVPAPSRDPGKPDATSSEPVASGPGFERACALDANQVLQFQSWVRAQGIPVR